MRHVYLGTVNYGLLYSIDPFIVSYLHTEKVVECLASPGAFAGQSFENFQRHSSQKRSKHSQNKCNTVKDLLRVLRIIVPNRKWEAQLEGYKSYNNTSLTKWYLDYCCSTVEQVEYV